MSYNLNSFFQDIPQIESDPSLFQQADRNNFVNSNRNSLISQNKSNHKSQPIKSSTSRKKFSFEEDEKLKHLVDKYGFRKWKEIANELPGRTERQCRDRYMNYLIPGVFYGQWSKQEDELLFKKYKEIGPHWSKMANFFVKRSANSLKNRWNYYVSKHINDYKINDNSSASTNDDIKFRENDNLVQNNKMRMENKKIENFINFASSYGFFQIANESNFAFNDALHYTPFVFNDII